MADDLMRGDPETVSVRVAASSDLEQLTPLFDAYRVFYGQSSDVERAGAFLRDRLSAHDSTIFLARIGGIAVGFIQMYPAFSSVSTSRIWILNDLYVDEAERRAGVARALMTYAARWAKDHGASRLILETAVDNTPAKWLYDALGWRQVTSFDRYELIL